MPALQKPKQERFAQLVASGVRPAEAAARAGYSERRAEVTASELKRDGWVTARIAELQAASAPAVVREVAYNRTVALQEAELARDLAMKIRKPGQAVGAVRLKAELSGLMVVRQQIEVTAGPLDGMGADELRQLERALAGVEGEAAGGGAAPAG